MNIIVEGTYACQCKEGFKGDGRTCYDIDECLVGSTGANQTMLHNCDDQEHFGIINTLLHMSLNGK